MVMRDVTLTEVERLQLAGEAEVAFEMDEETFENMSPRLDELVAEFDLVSHVQRRSSSR